MRLLANILWFIFGGFIAFFELLGAGLLCCITIVGIPFGMQCFKLAGLAATPFGKEVVYDTGVSGTLGNILWVIFAGWETALTDLILGAVLCLTIIGIPLGKQFFKLAAVSFMPFGAEINVEHVL
ncbi:MAG: YccF domain-containing protein [Clostridiales bacterium]|nr:YccF domain-containing protein [Clostridiales bacterium]